MCIIRILLMSPTMLAKVYLCLGLILTVLLFDLFTVLSSTTLAPLLRRPGSVRAVGNPGSVPAQSFIICKFIASIVQNVK